MHHKPGDWMLQRATAQGGTKSGCHHLSAYNAIDLSDEAQTNLSSANAMKVPEVGAFDVSAAHHGAC